MGNSGVRRFLRAGSIPIYGSTDGHGQAIASEDYPYQSLFIETTPYDWFWLDCARFSAYIAHLADIPVVPASRASVFKFWGIQTPLGTPLSDLWRTGRDMLSAPCGECGRNVTKCVCWRISYSAEDVEE